MNLIEKKYDLNSYYCTWSSQANLSTRRSKDGTALSALMRDTLNEENVFGEDGLVNQFPTIRDKLIFVFDDGWDVPYGLVNNDKGDFGSLIVNEERFPSFTGEPKERLKKLVDKVKSYGWKGVGLWICASAKGEAWENMLTHEERKEYWSERFEWSKYAGVSYWKVDWGSLCNDIDFRKLLNELKDKIYPELVIEHAVIMAPLSGVNDNDQTGRYIDWGDRPEWTMELMKFSDVIRTYDVSGKLSIPTTVDRVQFILSKGKELNSKSYINAEDEAYVCSALSLETGVMSNLLKNPDGTPMRPKSTENIRAVNWLSCFAPPVAVGDVSFKCSDEILFDVCNFVNLRTWISRYGDRDIKQGAPAVVALNDELPNVEYLDDEKPYILCNRHKNGAFAIAVMPRFKQDIDFYTPSVNLNITQKIDMPIGIFGEVNQVNIEFDESVEDKKIFAQDLASDKAVDITSDCLVEKNVVKISGELISKIGKSENCFADKSKPGLVIKLV